MRRTTWTRAASALKRGAQAHSRRGDQRHRRGLHGVHDAAGARRRDAAHVRGAFPGRAACVGQALEAPRRATAGRRHLNARPFARRSVPEILRRRDLQRMDAAEILGDRAPRAGRLRGRTSADRCRRLVRPADDGLPDTQLVRGRLQRPLERPGAGFPSQEFCKALDPEARQVSGTNGFRISRRAGRARRRCPALC